MKKDYIIAGLALAVVYLLWDKNKTRSIESESLEIETLDTTSSKENEECKKASYEIAMQKRKSSKMSNEEFDKLHEEEYNKCLNS